MKSQILKKTYLLFLTSILALIFTVNNAVAHEPIEWNGDVIQILLDKKDTGGEMGMFTVELAKPGGPGRHIHEDAGEAFYFLKGSAQVLLGDKLIDVEEGKSVFVPKGVEHTFRIQDEEGGKVLVVVAPAGFEGFFEATKHLKIPADMEEIGKISLEYGQKLTGPPLEAKSIEPASAIPLKQFVVMLDSASGDKLSSSQAAAAKSNATDTLESKFSVSLQEEFQSKEISYEVLTAKDKGQLLKYLSALDLTPISVIETEFTNGPSLGGGEKVSDTPKDNHQVYVIERSVPGISGLPMEKMKEVSKGSQSVVAQFDGSLEWDRSYLTQEGTFCIYRTDDENKINKHGKIAGFPVDKVSPVKHVVHKFEF